MEGRPCESVTVVVASPAAAHVVEVFKGEAQHAWDDSRNAKARQIEMEEAHSSGGALGLGASHVGDGGRL